MGRAPRRSTPAPVNRASSTVAVRSETPISVSPIATRARASKRRSRAASVASAGAPGVDLAFDAPENQAPT